MFKHLIMLLLMMGLGSWGYSQQVIPRELYKAIGEYLNDSQSLKRNLKGNGFDTTIKVSEIDYGIPSEVYTFKENAIDHMIDNDSTLLLIRTTGCWDFALKARGQYLFGVKFCCKDGSFIWARTGGSVSRWKQVRAAYPESSGINPIVIKNGEEEYLHFPSISKNNLTLFLDSAYRQKLIKERNSFKDTTSNDFKDVEDLLSISTDSYLHLIDKKKLNLVFKNRKDKAKMQHSLPRSAK